MRNVVDLERGPGAAHVPRTRPIGPPRSSRGGEGRWLTVVGVADNVKNNGLLGRSGSRSFTCRGKHSPDIGFGATAIVRTGANAKPRWRRGCAPRSLRSIPHCRSNIETMQQQIGKLAAASALQRAAARDLRGRRTLARGHRTVRRDLVPGGAADRRDRNPHGAGRDPAARSGGWSWDRPARWTAAGAVTGSDRIDLRGAADRAYAVPGPGEGPVGSRGRGRCALRCGYGGGVDSLSKSGALRSHAGVAAGVA